MTLPYFSVKTKQEEKPAFGLPNAYRLETLVFDIFRRHKYVVGYHVDPVEEYAMAKQPTGKNSPTTAVLAVGLLHQKWIIANGGEFDNFHVASDAADERVEISPLVSYE